MHDGDAGIIRRSVGGGNCEHPGAILVGGEKAAVKPVDVGHELLREQNAQAQCATVGIDDIDAASCARASRRGGETDEEGIEI